MSAHALEPWETYIWIPRGSADGEPCIGSAPNPQHYRIAVIDTEANAARIVACVNACAGINPEAVPDLLTAAEAILINPPSWTTRDGGVEWPDRMDTLRAAIAKAKP